jgi:hypothetical protein
MSDKDHYYHGKEDPDCGIGGGDGDVKLTAGSSCDTGWYQAPDDTFRIVIDGVQIGCSACKFWNDRGGDEGWCEMNDAEENDKFWIDDRHVTSTAFITCKDFICGLFVRKGNTEK